MNDLAPSPLGAEALDDPGCPEPVARATLGDLALVNRLFGGVDAAWFGLTGLLGQRPPTRITLLDVGSGSGDLGRALRARARRRGVTLIALNCDRSRVAARLTGAQGDPVVVADAAALPIRAASVDVILASQFLHHFSRAAAADLVVALARLARLGVVITEPRRSRGAMAGIWLAARALRLHPATRHDGVLSVRRSFTAPELAATLAAAGVHASVHDRPWFRLVAAWRTEHAHR